MGHRPLDRLAPLVSASRVRINKGLRFLQCPVIRARAVQADVAPLSNCWDEITTCWYPSLAKMAHAQMMVTGRVRVSNALPVPECLSSLNGRTISCWHWSANPPRVAFRRPVRLRASVQAGTAKLPCSAFGPLTCARTCRSYPAQVAGPTSGTGHWLNENQSATRCSAEISPVHACSVPPDPQCIFSSHRVQQRSGAARSRDISCPVWNARNWER
jgi:hypothetical protein